MSQTAHCSDILAYEEARNQSPHSSDMEDNAPLSQCHASTEEGHPHYQSTLAERLQSKAQINFSRSTLSDSPALLVCIHARQNPSKSIGRVFPMGCHHGALTSLQSGTNC